ncbi:MAG: guanosine-3',5'-bis(diphosphate) 3'-pyrophosphohydrolase [Gammaproteobacteria bacterium]|nr:MAG: guanosine-3',5'-bis(diphosphate) 3'-pyrophosphohydrolase [Gammaproteobacteria bacterium]
MRYADAKYYDGTLSDLADIEASIDQLLKQANYLDDDEKQQLIDCCFFSACAHRGQTRKSGEPYVCHPIKVAEILAREVQFDLPVLFAGILHDVIEDTEISKAEVVTAFDQEVADLVDGVSKLEKDKNLSPKELQARTFQKLVHAMEADPRVVMIKFADRMHNMQTLGALKPDKRRRIAEETLDVYVPIASRLGMFIFKTQLEELVFKQIHPWRYKTIKRLLRNNQKFKETVDEITKTLTDKFKEENIEATIRRRRRSFYNIYKKLEKMRFNQQPLEKASIPFVVLTNGVEDCYRALGLIHQIYTPVFGKLTDYIASPKVNGYQSLHTAVLANGRQRVINFQIRTKGMHSIAESGILAIWRHHNQEKNAFGLKGLPRDKYIRRWLENIKDISQAAHSPLEFYEAVKYDLDKDAIQVLTPKGEPIALPEGASVIDFAYHIHTEIGDHLSGAQVNGVNVDITFCLDSGQTVELLSSPGASPTSEWLNHVTTGHARTSIRRYLRDLPAEKLEKIGLHAMEKYLSERKVNYGYLQEMLTEIANNQYSIDLRTLLHRVALHKVSLERIYNYLQHLVHQNDTASSITITMYNQPGVLAAVAHTIGAFNANILRIDFPDDMQAEEVSAVFEIHTELSAHFREMLDALRQLDLVRDVSYEER